MFRFQIKEKKIKSEVMKTPLYDAALPKVFNWIFIPLAILLWRSQACTICANQSPCYRSEANERIRS